MNAWKMRAALRAASLAPLVCLLSIGASLAPAQESGEWTRRSAASTPAAKGSLGLLVRNADTQGGKPPFALVDQFGQVQRYVEPTPGVNLAHHVGSRVVVRHDTGRTLLASQLEFTGGVQPIASHSAATPPAPFAPPRDSVALRAKAEQLHQTQYEGDPDKEPIVLEDVIPEMVEAPEATQNANGEETSVLQEQPVGDSPAVTVEPSETTYYVPGPSRRKRSWMPLPPLYDSNCPECGKQNGCAGPTCCPPSEPGPYGRVEYVLWWFDGFDTPPLVTGGTAGSAGVIGATGTTILHGGEVLDGSRDGLRLSLGAWLDDQRDFAIEGDVLLFDTETETFTASDVTGSTVIARPYFDLATLMNTSRLVSFPGSWAGSVSVRESSEFDSYGLRLRTGLACRELGGGCSADGCSGCPGGVSRVDFTVGYRYASLDESLLIVENRTTTGTSTPTIYDGQDLFETDNDFHGVDLGFIAEWETKKWTLELVSRIALGNTEQQVAISGAGEVNGTPEAGSLLALGSNIGVYERDRFSVLPELSARLAYRVSPHLRVGVTYSLLYWANVVRPGDQIDLDIDPALIPPGAAAPTVSSHPQFAFHETSMWAHGLSFSLDGEY